MQVKARTHERYLLLNEDIDTVPERHAFLGNYRRFCADVIEVLVRSTPSEAMEHILSQATNMFQSLYSNQPPFERKFPCTRFQSVAECISSILLQTLSSCAAG